VGERPDRALILDWGGVLTSPVEDSFRLWALRHGLPLAALMRVLRRMHDTANSPLQRVEIGDITGRDFEECLAEEISAETGCSVAAENLLAGLFGYLETNAAVVNIVGEAETQGWKIGILSNAWGHPYDMTFLSSVASVILTSDEIGIRKPDTGAYRLTADRLRVRPGNCVFVDDLRRNVRGAQAAGMTGFVYSPGAEQALGELVRTFEGTI